MIYNNQADYFAHRLDFGRGGQPAPKTDGVIYYLWARLAYMLVIYKQ